MADLDDIARRHERHICQNHRKPGICVGCHQRWPCDARRLLDALGGVSGPGRFHLYVAGGTEGGREATHETTDRLEALRLFGEALAAGYEYATLEALRDREVTHG